MDLSKLSGAGFARVSSPFSALSSLPEPTAAALAVLSPDSIDDWGVDPRCDPFGVICLGPATEALGCGSAGLTGVPDKLFGLDLTAACVEHDRTSPPLFERNAKPLGEVLATQARFFRDIVEAGGDSLLGRLGAGLVATPYTAAVGVVGVAQWAANRVLDGVDAASSFIGGAFERVSDWGASLASTVGEWFS